MKLRQANIDDNRRFHELAEDQRAEALDNWCSQALSGPSSLNGEFTLRSISEAMLSGTLSREDTQALNGAAHKLNFLMTRLNMTGKPDYEDQIKELALLRYEYQLLTGNLDYTQNPKLVADFFKKRGKPELVRPVLERMGDEAVRYEHLAERVIDHPVFLAELGAPVVNIYKFRSRMQILISDEDYDREQAAKALQAEGFDLLKCDFNRWYESITDFSINIGDKEYQESEEDTNWLLNFVSESSDQSELSADSTDLVTVDEEEEFESEGEYNCSKEAIEDLAIGIDELLAEAGDDPELFWLKELAVLVADHAEISLDSNNLVQAKMWDYLWGGCFHELAHQLKGAVPSGKTRQGLNYNRWALTHEEHKKNLDPILAEDSLAMIIAGSLLVGDLKQAKEDLNAPNLQEYRNNRKIKAAVNLAWEKLQHHGLSDDPDNEYEPPVSYLFEIASDFADALKDTPSAAPYINFSDEALSGELGEGEQEVLSAITDFGTVETVCQRLGIVDQIKERFLEIFDETYDKDTEFMSLYSEIRGIISVIQNPIFQKYVDEDAIGERLFACIQRSLTRKNEYSLDEQAPEPGAHKLALTICQNSILRPYIENRLDISQMLNGMLDDVVGSKDQELLTDPCSLMHNGELVFGSSALIEAYILADRLREHVDPLRMKKLVAYLLAICSDMSVSSSLRITSFLIDEAEKQKDPQYQRPDYFPNELDSEESQRLQFISKVLQRERELGGLDEEMTATAVTNVIFRGTYVMQNRFYPRLDTVLGFLDAPVAELLPAAGLGHDAIKEYKILREFLRD